MKKTNKMLAVEAKFKSPLENLLPKLVDENEGSLSATAEYIGVSKATFGYWLMKMGITVRKVLVIQGQTIKVVRDGDETSV